MQQYKKDHTPPTEETLKQIENEDGSVTFQEDADDDGFTTFTE